MNLELLNSLKTYKVKNISIINDPKCRLNAIVKQIYVINMNEDIRKRNYIFVLFKKYKINYNLIIVDKIDKEVFSKLCKNSLISESELGCCMSHMWCLIHILKNEFENAIIFEDDVILSKKFIDQFLNVHQSNPKLDFLMLGAHDYNFSNNFKHIKNNIYRPEFDKEKRLYGAHANFYSYNGAKRMFYIRATNLSFFDNEYNLLFDTIPNSYICYPNLAISNMSESRINHEKLILSKNEFEYYSQCFKDINLFNYNFIYANLLDISLAKKEDEVDSFIERCLFKYFNDFDKITLVKKRFVLDFFTMDDIKNMLSIHSLITPNSLSKKCIGENS